MKKWFKVGSLVLMALLIGACAWLRWRQEAPRRVSLATLQNLGAALDSVDSASLLNQLLLPSAISSRTVPEQVEFITKALRDEITPEGIEMLRKHGQFGALKDLFPTEADGWAKQAGVRVEDCVAFKRWSATASAPRSSSSANPITHHASRITSALTASSAATTSNKWQTKCRVTNVKCRITHRQLALKHLRSANEPESTRILWLWEGETPVES